MSITIMPSAEIFRKYKRYQTWKAKVVVIDGSRIKSQLFDEPFESKEAAKQYAEKMIQTKQIDVESILSS